MFTGKLQVELGKGQIIYVPLLPSVWSLAQYIWTKRYQSMPQTNYYWTFQQSWKIDRETHLIFPRLKMIIQPCSLIWFKITWQGSPFQLKIWQGSNALETCHLVHGKIEPYNWKHSKVQMLLKGTARFVARLNLTIENVARFKSV